MEVAVRTLLLLLFASASTTANNLRQTRHPSRRSNREEWVQDLLARVQDETLPQRPLPPRNHKKGRQLIEQQRQVSRQLQSSTRSVMVDCFVDKDELFDAVDDYMLDPTNNESAAALRYGYPMGTWCVDDLEDFSFLFDAARRNPALWTFNEDISTWNMRNARDLSDLFVSLPLFDQNLTSWDTRRATNMAFMFFNCTSFNGDISGWNVANVRDMTSMFNRATSFRRPLGRWETGSLEKARFMFFAATNFLGTGLQQWDTSRLTDIHGFAFTATLFQTNLGRWQTRQLQDAGLAFAATELTGIRMGTWNVRNLVDASFMFAASRLQEDLSAWQLRSLETAEGMFQMASEFNVNLCGWERHMSSATVTTDMFVNSGCDLLTEPDRNRIFLPAGPYCQRCTWINRIFG